MGREIVLKLMAEYQAFPVWRRDCRNSSMVDPHSLPIQEDLLTALWQWSRDYEDIMVANGYEWPSENVRRTWQRRGETLWHELRSSLPLKYRLGLNDERTGEIVWSLTSET